MLKMDGVDEHSLLWVGKCPRDYQICTNRSGSISQPSSTHPRGGGSAINFIVGIKNESIHMVKGGNMSQIPECNFL